MWTIKPANFLVVTNEAIVHHESPQTALSQLLTDIMQRSSYSGRKSTLLLVALPQMTVANSSLSGTGRQNHCRTDKLPPAVTMSTTATVLFFSHSWYEGWPHHGRTFSIYLCRLSFWLTLPWIVLSTYWCCPSRSCEVFLACVHLALFLALSLPPGNSLVSSWCDHSMLASVLWQYLKSLFTPALLRTHLFVFFAVHKTSRIFLSPFMSKPSRRVSLFFFSEWATGQLTTCLTLSISNATLKELMHIIHVNSNFPFKLSPKSGMLFIHQYILCLTFYGMALTLEQGGMKRNSMPDEVLKSWKIIHFRIIVLTQRFTYRQTL